MYSLYKDVLQLKNIKTSRLPFQDAAERVIRKQVRSTDTGSVSEDFTLSIVKPVNSYMPTKKDYKLIAGHISPAVTRKILKGISGVIAVDLETKGTQAADIDCEIVGLGIASATELVYFSFKDNSELVNQTVLDFLSNYNEGLVGHNIFFDAAFLQRYTGKWLDWRYDTYAMYKQLENGGHPKHKHGLKTCQTELLNWDHKGDVDLDYWLVENGYEKSVSTTKKGAFTVYVPDHKGNGPRYASVNKGEMWRAPAHILGYYCALDVAATWQLLHECLLPCIKEYSWRENYLQYHEVFCTNVKLLVEQQLKGITIDKLALERYHINLKQNIITAYDTFINHKSVRSFASMLNERAVNLKQEGEPEKFKKRKSLGKEPAQFTKSGAESKNWIKWNERRIEIETTEPDISKNWITWSEQIAALKEKEMFNLNSSQQLTELFYTYLSMPIKMVTPNGDPSTGAKALPGLGEVGKLLKNYKDLAKLEGYVKACLDNLIQDAEGYYRIHPQFRIPGTHTCRLAGSGGINLQQLPKDPGYLECWKPMDKNRTWIDYDVVSLEQVVMAELSEDKSLMELYGPEANSNHDVYLFNGANLPIIGPIIRESGYDPYNPTAESKARAKKMCKRERSIAKVITLASSYGAGPGKIRETLELQGIDISFDEAKQIHAGYWELYQGVKVYEKKIRKEWSDNGGWMLNGIGRPVCCDELFNKDLVNRVVQSTGHDILMYIIAELDNLRTEWNVDFNPIIIDFHDESLVECNIEDKEKVIKVFKEAYRRVNNRLNGIIPIREDGGEMLTLAEAKIDKEQLEEYRNEKR